MILFVSLFELDVYDPFNTYFVNIKSVEWEHVVNLIIGMLISFQRVFVLYAMGLIVKYTLSATISLLHVMTVKMKKG